MSLARFSGVSMLLVLMASTAAHAADPDAKGAPPAAAAPEPSPWLFGDWNGARTRLKDRGIDFQFGYTNEIAYNATGGSHSTGRYADQYTAGVTFDLDRLLGIPSATFQTTITERTGRNLSDDAELGTLQQVQEVFGRGQTVRLTDFWYQQKFLGGLLDWKVGRMPFGEDFAAFSCEFQNLTFCGANPGNLVGNYIFNWPISQWATRIKVNVPDFGYIQVGVYDINPRYLGVSDQVLPVWFPDSTGAMIPVEVAWLPKFGDAALEGSYKVGGWYDTSMADDVVSDINGDPMVFTGLPPMQRRGRYGGYINFQQQVTESLTVFLNAVIADKRTAFTDRQIALGLMYKGLFSARPEDDVGFAVGTTHVNNRVADVQSLQNALGDPVAVQDSEYAFELYYTYRPRAGLLFRPNLQYVHLPGGTSDNNDVFVLGLKTSANF